MPFNFRKTFAVTFVWLVHNFEDLQEGAAEAVVERYARVWLWHFMGGFLFPDSSRNTISWALIPILSEPWENIRGYSWGSAILAWMY